MLNKLKALFTKKTYPCIVWDGKCMKYLDLTKKEIENIEKNPEYKDWSVTINHRET